MDPVPTRVDVLVVGYGPVGAALAALLGGYGVRTLVVDRAPDVLQMPRAIALDNEALRILQMAGLGEGTFAVRAIPRVRYHSPYAGEFAQVNTAGCLDGHPRLVTFYQPELERALRARVASLPSVATATGVEMTGFRDTGAAVVVTLRTPDGGVHEVEAAYLVGADGAASGIRKAIGQDFSGQTYPEEWLIVDAERPNAGFDEIEFVCDPRRPTPHMPAPGDRERWEFMLHPGEDREAMERPETVRELLAPYGDVAAMKVERRAVYRFHARTCERFLRGRVVLAGDAAHVTPPFVGQGLVAGLRDAANLAWKLAWIVRGAASPAVLESYDTERRPHARAMIDLARFMGHLIMPRSRLKALLVHGTVRALRLLPWARSWFDDLRIKPENAFRRGLVAPGTPGAGRWFPQGLLRTGQGELRLADDVFGARFVLVGAGVDPARHLDAATLGAWTAAGGATLRLEPRGGARDGDACEDLTGVMVPGALAVGRVAVLRPDRTIMHTGSAADAERLVRECLALLAAGGDSPRTATPTRMEPARS
ncbi:MAG: bifunctional 3-(3-hydroxy-phenyl)propionate/3-hydroxycinnamic acid hydroxylase [Steroidobacteraceae bacterium]